MSASKTRSTNPFRSRTEVLIAVMGMTGSGKSSFVKTVTRDDRIVVGHSLCSETSDVQVYKVTIGSFDFVLVDTPGFDDTYGADSQILNKIASWLSFSYESSKLLTGLLYIHPITQPRMTGSIRRSMRMFEKLCGNNCYQNVVLGTTFWDQVNKADGGRRERELCDTPDFWKGMKDMGSRVIRMSRDYETCCELLLEMAKQKPVALQIQEELVVQGKQVQHTSAGLSVDEDMAKVKAEQAAKFAETTRLNRESLARKDRELKWKEEKEKFRLNLEAQELKANEAMENAMEERRMRYKLKEMEDERMRQLENKRREAKEESKRQEDLLAVMEALHLEEMKKSARRTRDKDARSRRNWMEMQNEELRRQLSLLDFAAKAGLTAIYNDTKLYPSLVAQCDNCAALLGSKEYYMCPTCVVDNSYFAFCSACAQRKHYCLDDGHENFAIEHNPDGLSSCQRARNPVVGVDCDRCGGSCMGLYFHCCACDEDNFDLCLTCVMNGRHCRNQYHKLVVAMTPALPARREIDD